MLPAIRWPVLKRNGQEFSSADELLHVLAGESSGQFLVGSQGMWHGGIHITDATVPWCALSTGSEVEMAYCNTRPYQGEQFIRCMADGEIVAFRVCKDYASEAIPWRDEELHLSTSFVLVRHVLQPDESADSKLTFYTLYMNLAPFAAYASPGSERERKTQGSQRYYASEDDVLALHAVGTLAKDTRVMLSDRLITRHSDQRQFTEVTLSTATKNAAGEELAAGTTVWTVSDQGSLKTAGSSVPAPAWWAMCAPAYGIPSGDSVPCTSRTDWSYYLSAEDVRQRKAAGKLSAGFPLTYEPGNMAQLLIRPDKPVTPPRMQGAAAMNTFSLTTPTEGQQTQKTGPEHTFSLVTLGRDTGKLKKGDRVWVVSDGDSLTPVTTTGGEPKFGEVVQASVPINAGDSIGHMGFYERPEENGKRGRYQVHIECLSMDDMAKYITNPGRAGEQEPALVKYPAGATLFIKDAQGKMVDSTRKSLTQGVATRSAVPVEKVDGHAAYYQLHRENGWLAAADIELISQYALAERGFVTLNKAGASFDLIDGTLQPDNLVKVILEQLHQAAQAETRPAYALNQYNYQRLLEHIDSNKDGHYSIDEYLQAIQNVSYRERLQRLIVKHASEWYYGKDDPLWKTYLDTLTNDAPLWKTFLETFIGKMGWMKQVEGMGPELWHMHPVTFLDALTVKNKGSLKGKLTYDAEGNNIPSSQFYSRVIHWPGEDESGVTLGRGYDMGNRSEESIYQDMIASGVDDTTARKISLARRYKGSEANSFVTNNRDDIGEITEEQQINLFNIIYPSYVTRAIANYNSWTSGVSTAKKWEQLDAVIQEVLVDFVYQGFTKGPNPMLAGANNDKQELINYIRNTPGISKYEPGRYRANYLEKN